MGCGSPGSPRHLTSVICLSGPFHKGSPTAIHGEQWGVRAGQNTDNNLPCNLFGDSFDRFQTRSILREHGAFRSSEGRQLRAGCGFCARPAGRGPNEGTNEGPRGRPLAGTPLQSRPADPATALQLDENHSQPSRGPGNFGGRFVL